MFTLRKRYKKRICRGLLLVGYLFLFAEGFNGHYFGIVNFFIFGKNGHAGLLKKEAAFASLTLNDSSQRPEHLAVDKRFHFKQCVRVGQIGAPHALSGVFASIRFFIQEPHYLSIETAANALRGPPGV